MLISEDLMREWRFKLIKALAFIHKQSSLTNAKFQDYYETRHAPLAKSLLTFESYERNYIDPILNSPIEDLGSISIFKYSSEEALAILTEQMMSDAGDTLRNDELNFMNVPLNFYVFTDSIEEISSAHNRKIFYLAKDNDQLTRLDSESGIEKISENLIVDNDDMIGIPEYGISQTIKLKDLEIIAKKFPGLIFSNSVT